MTKWRQRQAVGDFGLYDPVAAIDLRLTLGIALLLVAQTLSPIVVDASSLLLLVTSVISPLAAIRSLALVAVIRFLNPAFVSLGSISVVVFFIIPIIVGIRFCFMVDARAARLLAPIWVFAVIAAFCSLIKSPLLSISLLKAFNFALVVTGIFTAMSHLNAAQAWNAFRWLISIAFVVALLSLASLASPARAFHPDTMLLRGALLHPQALGAYLAPFISAVIVSWVAGISRGTQKFFIVLSAFVVTVILTRSRTAMVASLLACLIPVFIGKGLRADSDSTRRIGRVVLASIALLIAVLAIDLSGGGASDGIKRLIFKRGETEVGEALHASRGGGAIQAWNDFAQSPIVGHGFGVNPNGELGVGVTTFYGVPISAPTEKGFLPTAVLDETGLIGGVAFFFLIRMLASRGALCESRSLFGLLLAGLFVNLGEAVLFSPGGLGLQVWICIAFGVMGGGAMQRGAQPLSRQGMGVQFPNLLH